MDRIGAQPDQTHDSEIFDDDDFYQTLLKEFIDQKSSETSDPIQISRSVYFTVNYTLVLKTVAFKVVCYCYHSQKLFLNFKALFQTVYFLIFVVYYYYYYKSTLLSDNG